MCSTPAAGLAPKPLIVLDWGFPWRPTVDRIPRIAFRSHARAPRPDSSALLIPPPPTADPGLPPRSAAQPSAPDSGLAARPSPRHTGLLPAFVSLGRQLLAQLQWHFQKPPPILALPPTPPPCGRRSKRLGK